MRGEFGTPKSKRSTRSVPMADEVAGGLERRFQQSRWRADDLVSGHPATGGPLPMANGTRRMHSARKAAKLDTSHRFHDLRHTFGTRMAAAGVPMRTLQEWMGHRDLATSQIYADYAPKHARGRDGGRGIHPIYQAERISDHGASRNGAVEPASTLD